MADAVMIIDDIGKSRAQAITAIARELAVGIGGVLRDVENKKPLFRKKLFDRNTPMFAERLLSLMNTLTALGCKWRAYQLTNNSEWNMEEQFFEIDVLILKNMISSWYASLEEQSEIGRLEDY